MLLLSLCVSLLVCAPALGQSAQTVMDNQVAHKTNSLAHMKYACSVIQERYQEVGENNITKPEIKTRLALVCCPGYRRDVYGMCQPYCEGGCGDGVCESPGMCTCPNTCAFNTIDRKCVCFNATCPAGCPANASCIADNTCDCNFAFVRRSNWTNQYTNSSAECVPYCYPFCTNKFLSSSPDHCICNYTQADNSTSSNASLADKHSHVYLGHMFQSYGHPSFTSGLTGFALGAVVGSMMGSFGKSKNKGGYIYGKPGGYGSGFNYPGGYGTGYNHPGGYGTGYNHPGGYGTGYNAPGGYGTGHNAPGGYGTGHNAPGGYGTGYNAPGGYGTGYNAPGGYGTGQGNAPYGGYPNTGQNTGNPYGAPQNTQYGGGYGQPHGQPIPSAPVQPQAGHGQPIPSAPVQPQAGHGQPSGTNYGWNTPGQNAHNTGTNIEKTSANTYGASAPSQSQPSQGQAGGTNYGWNTPGQNTGTNVQKTPSAPSGQHTNVGWNVPSSTNTGNTNYGWQKPSNTNTGSGNSGSGKGRGSGSGRKRGRKH